MEGEGFRCGSDEKIRRRGLGQEIVIFVANIAKMNFKLFLQKLNLNIIINPGMS